MSCFSSVLDHEPSKQGERETTQEALSPGIVFKQLIIDADQSIGVVNGTVIEETIFRTCVPIGDR